MLPMSRNLSNRSLRRQQSLRRPAPTFCPRLEVLEARWLPSTNVLTYHNDVARTGQNLTETALTLANVASATFGKQVTDPVDGQVYAQPLYVAGVDVPGQGTHDLVFVATEHDSVYAFDANGINAPNPIWHDSFINPGANINVVLASDVNCTQIAPEIGITGTPVIDPSTNTLYVVAMTKEGTGTSRTYHQRLHALDIATGDEKFGGPVEIQASVPGTGDGGTTVTFRPRDYKERPGLLLLNGVVYTSWSSHCDIAGHGWVIGYDAQTLQQTGVFCTSPNGQLNTIWEGGGALAADADGNIYFETGNGSAGPANNNYDEAFVKLSTDGGLSVADYFIPSNFRALDNADEDLGSGAPILLPDQPGGLPHLMVGAGKEGKIYLLDRDNLGQLNNPPTGPDQVVQEIPNAIPGGSWDTPAFFDAGSAGAWIYYAGPGSDLRAFSVSNGRLSTSPTSESSALFAYPGATPIISANGTDQGIVWAVQQGNPGVLHAYDATDLTHELYNSNQAGSRDHFGATVKFATPTVADGHVFVGTNNSLAIFGLIQVAGPSVKASSPQRDTFGPVSSARVIFNEPIDPSTFTLDQVSAFTVTAGSTTTDLRGDLIGVSAVPGSNNTAFDISFATEFSLGDYQMVIGPNILDTAGNPMDQDGDGIPGVTPSDQFTVHFALQGPKIIYSSPIETNHMPGDQIHSIKVTFNEPIDPTTFTTDAIDDFNGPNGPIPITGITPVAGSNDTQFRISFDPLVVTGVYTFDIGPFISDQFGNVMDQDGDFIPGQVPEDVYSGTFGIQGLQVTSAVLNSPLPGRAVSLRVTFNEPVDPLSFDTTQIFNFVGPDGSHTATGVVAVDGSNTRFDVQFGPLTVAGAYSLVIGPNIADVYGNFMDQDGNLIPGEPDDAYTANFTVATPVLVSATAPTTSPFDHVRLVFDRSMDRTTFDPSEFSVTDPDGAVITVTGVAAVSGTNDTTYDVSFAPVTTRGTYTLVIAAGISDTYGNALNPTTTTFVLLPVYTASAGTFQNIELFGQSGTQAVTFTSGSQFADDDFGSIDLGAGNTFNFYGSTFSRVFVSSNGLITFGSGNSEYRNTNLNPGTTTPTQPAIAPLWSDWLKSDDGTGPMILSQFTSDNRLIIEWNKIRHFGASGSARPITFQAILSLNTGGHAGDIVVNYVDLATGDANAEGRTSTIGVEDNAASSTARTLVSFNASNPLVGTGRAVRFTTG
jgi:hypothetical protein